MGDVVLALDKALENTDLLHGRWVNVVVFLDVNFFFFYIPLFAFGLIEQMEILLLNYPVSLFDLSTSGRGLFTYIVFLKMRVKTGMEFGEAFYLFSPCLSHQYSFPRKTKK